jgi:cystathionine beta-lyase/cystathionine gamma-synthase
MPKPLTQLDTRLIHAGEMEPRVGGAVAMPIFQSATYEYAGEAGYHDVKYIRLNNTPNHLVLHRKLAALENAEAALVTGSGMAAITTALFAALDRGGHLLAHKSLYGGTHDFLTKDFARFGLEVDFIDADDPRGWEQKLRPNTRAVYVESITNPLMEVVDLEAVVAFAKAHKLVSMIDNTFTSPVNFRPAEWGFDLSLHSATKYLNGHSDLVCGAVIGRADLVEKTLHALNHLGGSLDPHACFLLHRGLKTLALRVRHQNQSALTIARFLEQHPAVAKVGYPGLPSHRRHERARKLFDGFSGMLSFELKDGRPAVDAFLRKLTLPAVAPSLGGVESLITLPATTSHAGLTSADRQRLGIVDGLVRLSVGVEGTDDLIADLKQALP